MLDKVAEPSQSIVTFTRKYLATLTETKAALALARTVHAVQHSPRFAVPRRASPGITGCISTDKFSKYTFEYTFLLVHSFLYHCIIK